MTRTIRTETVGPYRVDLIRSAMGQVVEYDVHRTDERTGETRYAGGGTRREGERAFAKATREAVRLP